MGRFKGGHNRHTFHMGQRVTYRGRRAKIINPNSLSLLKKVVIRTEDKQERLEVYEVDLVKGWQ